MNEPSRAPVELCPITDADLPDVAQFLGRNFPPDTSPEEWADAWRESVNLDGSKAPNHGFMLRVGKELVGAYPVIYSTRLIRGREEGFCNLAVWYTAPEYRHHSIRMLRAILGQKGWHYTDLTPIDRVQKMNLRLGFQYLDTTTLLIPNVPWPTLPGRVRVSSDPKEIDVALSGPAHAVYRDHALCRWARHAVMVKGERSCYVQWRREPHKNLPIFASIRYVSDPSLFRSEYRALGSHLLIRFGALFATAELRVIGGSIKPSFKGLKPKPRMFKSETLGPEDIDYLYSEITSAP